MCPIAVKWWLHPRLQFKGWDGREDPESLTQVHLSYLLDAYSDVASSSFLFLLASMICLSLHASACSFKLTPGSLLCM